MKLGLFAGMVVNWLRKPCWLGQGIVKCAWESTRKGIILECIKWDH